jgi:hypothetical protein
MGIMKMPEGTNICQKFCLSSSKLHQCNSQNDIDSILFVVSGSSVRTYSEDGIGLMAGICSKDGVGVKPGIGLDAGTVSNIRIISESGTGMKAGIGSDAGTVSDPGIQRNNSLGNSTKTMYPVMMDNITTPLITIFCLFF